MIAGIEIVVNDVFDLSRPSENNWLSRIANAAHIETRDRVVARELLFAAGEVANAQRIRETERNLRRHPFIREARIVPVPAEGNAVSARVEVDDAWSLGGGVDLSQSGGNLEWSVRVDEVNLLGGGKRLFFEHEDNLERSANEIGYVDPQVLGSRWVLSAGYGDLSDGSTRVLVAERPYFSLETAYAVGGFVTAFEQLLTQYNHGQAVNVIPSRRKASMLYASRAYRIRERSAFRIGVSYRADENEYDAPIVSDAGLLPAPDISTRRVRGMSATWSMVQDRSAAFQNLARIGRTEDYNLGWTLSGGAGYFARSLGSAVNAPFGEAALTKGWSSGPRGLMLVNAAVRGRHETDGWRDAATRAALTVYRRAAARPDLRRATERRHLDAPRLGRLALPRRARRSSRLRRSLSRGRSPRDRCRSRIGSSRPGGRWVCSRPASSRTWTRAPFAARTPVHGAGRTRTSARGFGSER